MVSVLDRIGEHPRREVKGEGEDAVPIFHLHPSPSRNRAGTQNRQKFSWACENRPQRAKGMWGRVFLGIVAEPIRAAITVCPEMKWNNEADSGQLPMDPLSPPTWSGANAP